MKKRITAIALTVIMVLMIATVMTACPAPDKNPNKEPVVITEDFSYSNPEDLEFDDRVALKVAGSAIGLSAMNVTYAWVILYANDDTPVLQVEIYVCSDAAAATALNAMFGNTLTVEGNCVLTTKGEVEISAVMMALSFTTFDQYVDMYASMGYAEVTAEE